MPEEIQELSEGLQRIKTHLAWLSLKEQERKPGAPPALVTDPDLAAAMRDESSHFMATATDIHESLNNREKHHLPEKRCQEWRGAVLKLEAEFHRLNLPKAF